MADVRITPSLWFQTEEGRIEPLLTYYARVFADSFSHDKVMPLGQTPSGNAEMCQVHLFGQTYMFMSTEKEHHPLNDAISLIIACRNQAEIDHYWDYFTREGKESQCGWCIDRYGLRWQVIPQNMGELLRTPNGGEVLMQQRKIIIAAYGA